MPSRASALAQAVPSTTLSPMRTTHATCACFARCPVSNCRDLPPASSTEAVCFMVFLSDFRSVRFALRSYSCGKHTSACVTERDNFESLRLGPADRPRWTHVFPGQGTLSVAWLTYGCRASE